MIFLVLIGFSLLVALEIPPLIKKKYWRELVAFSLLTAGALFLSILQTFGVELPYIESILLETYTKFELILK